MPADQQILVAGTAAIPLSYEIPNAVELELLCVNASFDGSGAASSYVPTVEIISDGGVVIGRVPVKTTVAAGGSAEVTFAPFLRDEVAAVTGTLQNRNFGQLGYSLGTTLSDTQTHTIQIQDVLAGDGVLVSISAPSLPSGLASEGFPFDVEDTQGNTYFFLTEMILQANPATVNTGVLVRLYYCLSSVAPLVAGVDVITVTWNNPVYDRTVGAYLVRHDGGTRIPTVLGQTADHDAAVFAASQVTLTQHAWAPERDDALSVAFIYNARPLASGQAAYGGVGGYSGFYEASEIVVLETGSQQTYAIHQQTHGADVYVQLGPSITTNEIDIGTETGGVLIPAFNGVGQAYFRPIPTPEVNVWKGIILLGLD